MDGKKIGEMIADARMRKNITQEDLAQELHVCRQAISRWECGVSVPDLNMIIKVLNYLELDVNQIMANGE